MNGTIDLSAVGVFARVAELASFRRAAEALGIPRSTVSRRVAELENALGARLLQRTTRKVALTAAGTTYLHACRPALAALADAAQAVSHERAEARGRLRITAPVGFGEGMLGEVVDEYLRAHPHVTVELVLTDRQVDLVQEGFDLAFRSGSIKDLSLVARELARAQPRCFASRAYLRAHGPLRVPRDLERHDCILFAPLAHEGRWTFRTNGRTTRVAIRPRLTVNSLRYAVDAAARGLGVVRLPGTLDAAATRARLVEVLAAYAPPPRSVYLVYPSGGHVSPPARAFLELATRRLVL